MRQAKPNHVSPEEAGEIISDLLNTGLTIDDIASRLGVTRLYATRLEKPAYWKSGHIPLKTGFELRKLRESCSPEAYKLRILKGADELNEGDIYLIHSLLPVVEFHDRQTRAAILRCASRSVRVIYMFPSISEILKSFPTVKLDIAELINPDLRYRYEILMQTLREEAYNTKCCPIKKMEKFIEFREVINPFVFSPWNKLIYTKTKGRNGFDHHIYQEHHSFEPLDKGFGTFVCWSCDGNRAENVARILLSADSQELKWGHR